MFIFNGSRWYIKALRWWAFLAMLTLAVQSSGIALPAEAQRETFLWIEAENMQLGSAHYTVQQEPAASGGRYIKGEGQPSGGVMQFYFESDYDSTYDIWILGTPASLSYISRHSVGINQEPKPIDQPPAANSALYDAYVQGSGIEVCWTKAQAGVVIPAGQNLLQYAMTERQGDAGVAGVLDSIVIVPSAWGWAPYQLRAPYDGRQVKVEFVSGTLEQETIVPGESMRVRMYFSVPAAQQEDPTFFIALTRRGEIVTSSVYVPWLAVSSWVPQNRYNGSATLDIPFCAPAGEYTVVCGIGTADAAVNWMDGSRYALVGQVSCGILPDTEKWEAEFADFTEKTENGSIILDGQATASQAIDAAKAYVKLWQEDVLWGVCESQTAIDLPAGMPVDITVQARLPAGMPGGTYRLEIGIYGLNGTESLGELFLKGTGEYGYKPLSNGVYRSNTGREHFWYVNQANALIWDGEPYIPMGGMECLLSLTNYTQDMEALAALWAEDYQELLLLAREGIRDLYINPVSFGTNVPKWYWQFVLDTLDQLGFCYGFQYGMDNGTVREGTLYYVNAAGENRVSVSGVSGSGQVTAVAEKSRFTGFYIYAQAVSCQYIVTDGAHQPVAAGTGTLTEQGENYVFSAALDTAAPGPYTVTFTPLVEGEYNTIANIWDGLPGLTQEAASFARLVTPGDGFRMIIDPVANESGLYNAMESARPYTPETNRQYAAWLAGKYGAVETLCKAWDTADIDSFETAAALIPLYTTPAETDYRVYCTDGRSSRIYTVGGRRGVMWYDFLDFRDQSVAEAYNQIAQAYKTRLDVPVIVKNVWGTKAYFTNSRQAGGLDGIGAECYGSYSAIQDLTASSYSLCQTFAKTAWLIVTETSTDESVEREDGGLVGGYESQAYMNGHFDTLYRCGAKGVFDFLLSARHDQPTQEAYSYIEHPEMFSWTRDYRAGLDAGSISGSLPPGNKIYTLPYRSNYYTTPNRYTAVYHPDSYQALDFALVSEGNWFLPVGDPAVPGEILAANFADGPASCRYGRPFGQMLGEIPEEKKLLYLGFRKDLGTVPELDRFFTDRYAVNVLGERVQILIPDEGCQVLARTADGEAWALRAGNLWIVAAETFSAETLGRYIQEFQILESKTGLTASGTIDETGNGGYSFQAEIENHTGKPVQAEIILAAYDSQGRLLAAETQKVDAGPGVTEARAELAKPACSGEVRGMVWEGDSMCPLCPAVTAGRTMD